jgi:hypothetical protein
MSKRTSSKPAEVTADPSLDVTDSPSVTIGETGDTGKDADAITDESAAPDAPNLDTDQPEKDPAGDVELTGQPTADHAAAEAGDFAGDPVPYEDQDGKAITPEEVRNLLDQLDPAELETLRTELDKRRVDEDGHAVNSEGTRLSEIAGL